MNPNLNLGYCCINLELKRQDVFCARTMRLATFKANGLTYAQEVALRNLKDLQTILEWNAKYGITLFRVSSDMFPMASHPDCLYDLAFAQEELTKCGDIAKRTGQRLTLHPSQHHVLTANKDRVLETSIMGLDHQCEILDRMGMDKQSIIVIHGGGIYGDKESALARFEKNFLALKPNLRDRLVLENDEGAYTIEDLLPTCKKLDIPLVVDFHHDRIKPSSHPPEYYMEEVFAIWDKRGIKPKVHVSQYGPGVTDKNSFNERRKHGPYMDVLPEFLQKAMRPIDVMFEAKMKEESIFRYLEKQGVKIQYKLPAYNPAGDAEDEDMDEEESPKKKVKGKPAKTNGAVANAELTKAVEKAKKSAESRRKEIRVKEELTPAINQAAPRKMTAEEAMPDPEVPKKRTRKGGVKNEAVEADELAPSSRPKKRTAKKKDLEEEEADARDEKAAVQKQTRKTKQVKSASDTQVVSKVVSKVEEMEVVVDGAAEPAGLRRSGRNKAAK